MRPFHDIEVRLIRDLPVLDAATWLSVPRRRVACPTCGPRLERLDWLDLHARLCRVLPVKQVMAWFGLHWDTVKAIDKRALREQFEPVDLSGLTVLAMDEFALRRGHRYATVILEPHTRRVLWVGHDRSRASIRPFFEALGAAGCRPIKAVAMDMNPAYALEVKAHCPQAEIVYDLFHVVAQYGHDVIDRVRVDEANQTLMTVYILKDELKQLWRKPSPERARQAWQDWFAKATASSIAPLARFARKLDPYLNGIVSSARWKLNTSVRKGINNRIKGIKRMANGFRYDAYFFLKIKAAFPGNP